MTEVGGQRGDVYPVVQQDRREVVPQRVEPVLPRLRDASRPQRGVPLRAGTGIVGNTGDDSPATDAQLNRPFGVAVTADGGFLIADVVNNEVRKVSAD